MGWRERGEEGGGREGRGEGGRGERERDWMRKSDVMYH